MRDKRLELCCLSLILAAGAILAPGCKTTVNIKLHNKSKLEQSAVLLVQDNGITEQQQNLGSLLAEGDLQASLKIKQGKQVQVQTQAGGYNAWSSPLQAVAAKPDPLDLTFLSEPTAQILDDSAGLLKISTEFNKIGHNYGMLPMNARDAADLYLGALVLYIPPSDPTALGQELLRIPAHQFLGPTEHQTVNYVNNLSENSVEITGTSMATLSAAIPILAAGANYSNNSVYQFKWSVKNYGLVHATEPPDWNLVKGLENLPEEVRASLARSMADNPKAVLLYVSQMYAIMDLSVTSVKGTKLGAGANLSAGTVFGLNAAWTFNSSESSTRSVSQVVLNLDGEVIQADMIPKTVKTSTQGKVSETVEFAAPVGQERRTLSYARTPEATDKQGPEKGSSTTTTLVTGVRRTNVFLSFRPKAAKP